MIHFMTIDTGNTAWLLTSTMLVLLMSIPGIALFYGGLVRRKNVLSIIMQTIFLVAVVSILWVAIGYSWVFDTTFKENGNPLSFLIGGFGKVFMRGIGLDALTAGNIPELLFAMFQCMFAVITPALILGAVAGLVAITPAAGSTDLLGAFLIGIITSAICFCMVAVVKPRFRYDDSLDAFGVHGIGGIVGSILTGVFATRTVTGENGVQGALYGDWNQLLIQIVTTVFAIVFSAVITFVLFKAVDSSVGLRVDKRVEEEGLDIYEHGESAYNR